MQRRRPWFVIVILALVLLALVLQRLTGPARATSGAVDVTAVTMIDRATLRVVEPMPRSRPARDREPVTAQARPPR